MVKNNDRLKNIILRIVERDIERSLWIDDQLERKNAFEESIWERVRGKREFSLERKVGKPSGFPGAQATDVVESY